MKVCAVCGSEARKKGKTWYHKLPGYPQLETRVKEVRDEQYAKTPGIRPERAAPTKSHLVTETINL